MRDQGILWVVLAQTIVITTTTLGTALLVLFARLPETIEYCGLRARHWWDTLEHLRTEASLATKRGILAIAVFLRPFNIEGLYSRDNT